MSPDNDSIYDRHGQGTRTLDLLESAVRYNAWLASKIRPWLGARNLEIGAGAGTITEAVVAGADPEFAFDLVEPVEGLRAVLEERFRDRPGVSTRGSDFLQNDGEYECIYSANVLEHVPDWLAFVEHGAGLLAPGGHFVALVPAHAWLMSEFDRSIGHFRRFGRREADEVRALIGDRELPLELVEWRYFNPIGALGWLVKMRWLGQREVRPSDVRMSELLLPLHRALDAVDLGFGQSLRMVLRRTD